MQYMVNPFPKTDNGVVGTPHLYYNLFLPPGEAWPHPPTVPWQRTTFTAVSSDAASGVSCGKCYKVTVPWRTVSPLTMHGRNALLARVSGTAGLLLSTSALQMRTYAEPATCRARVRRARSANTGHVLRKLHRRKFSSICLPPSQCLN